MRVVEKEVEEVRVEWEASRVAIHRHQTTVTEMTLRMVSLLFLYEAHLFLYKAHQS